MAQLSHVLQSQQQPEAKQVECSSAELSRLLLRLQQTVLHPTPERERRLRASEYERARVESNLSYARTLLTKLEQEALRVKAPQRRHELQGVLGHKREILETLLDKLQDLQQIALENDDEDSSDGEDLLGAHGTTENKPRNSGTLEPNRGLPPEYKLPSPETSEEQVQSNAAAEALLASSLSTNGVTAAPHLSTQTTNIIRARRPPPSSSSQLSESQAAETASPTSRSSTPSSIAHSTARAALFANRRRPATPQTSTATAEAILDNQRQEQDALSDSILKMAGALKSSSQRFSSTLEADKDLVGRAGDAMEKTERGMEAAKGRMGLLKRMTEGKGWWGRLLLFAWVYGLMVALILLVFVMPKLRF